MAQNVKAADLIGKTIVNNEGSMSYRVINIDGDKLQVEFVAGDRPAIQMPMPWAQVEKLLNGGWQVQGEQAQPKAEEPIASEDTVEEVSDVQPAAKEVKLKRKVTLKKKGTDPTPDPSPTMGGECHAESDGAAAPRPSKGRGRGGVTPKLTYTTYKNKAGKTCAKIAGFAEGDAMLERAAAESIHASSTYERDKKGGKHYMLLFGPCYAAAAKEVCDAMNAGKSLDDCKAIIDQATEERQQKREEWKAKRAEYLARESEEPKAKDTASEKTYTESYLADLLTRATNNDAKALAELNKIMAKAA